MEKKSYPIYIALIVSIGGLLLGISAMISGASEFYRSYFDLTIGSFAEGLAVSVAMAGTFIGNLFAGTLSDKLGRKKALFIAAALFSFCTLGSGLATSYTFLVLTRFIGGLGIGISLLVAPMFIAEFSPSERRGFLVSFNQLNIGIGYMLAYLLNTIVLQIIPEPDITWRWMLGVGFAFPLIYMLLLIFVPESPRWLITKGRDNEAKKIMKRVGGDAYVNAEFDQIKYNIDEDAKKETPSFKVLWGELFTKRMRLVLLVAFSIGFFQMASGINAVFFFGPKIFRMAGFGAMNSFVQSNLIGIVMVIMTLVSMALIDKLGRKPLLYTGVSIMFFALITAGFSFNKATYKVTNETITTVTADINDHTAILLKVSLDKLKQEGTLSELAFFRSFKSHLTNETNDEELALSLYSNYKDKVLDNSININSMIVLVAILFMVIGFSISLGPITWTMLAEIFPGRLRGIGISMAGALNAFTSFLVGTLFPLELEKIGSANTFYIFAGFMLLCLVFVAKWYPETKGKTLEEIEKQLIKD